MLLISLLAFSLSLPSPAADAAVSTFEAAGMTPGEMNFDRHWATGVKLADSTVINCIQDVWLLPEVADSVCSEAITLAGVEEVPGGVDSLIHLMAELKMTYSTLLDTLSCADSLAILCGGMWAVSDSLGTPGEFGLIYSSRGYEIPFSEDDMEIELDEYTRLLTRWPGIDIPDPELIIGLVMGIEPESGYGTMTAPGVQGRVFDYSLAGELTWVVGDRGRNIYTGETVYDVIIDTGGDDLYLCGAEAIGVTGRPVSVIAGLAGNDSYISTVPVSQGSGFMGYGALVDLQGDDVYRGSSMAQGSALMGGGLFADLAGNDYCTADVHSQGAATLGTSHFIDLEGDDIRKVSAYGQGFGGPAGYVNLIDSHGCDTYLAGFTYPHEPLLPRDHIAMSQGFGTGLRPFCAGGVGTLCDLGTGNDTYRAEVFGQGGAYFYSLGILFDTGGQDVYSAAQYSQGSGIHLASGILVDADGDDQYVSRRGPSQGAAHDLSTGFLIDMEGEDYYATDGGQGVALTNSAAVFMDLSGSDLYALRGLGQGESRWSRGSAGSGLFLDLADTDYYLGAGADTSTWIREYSAGADFPGVTPVPQDETVEIGNPGSLDIDSLFSVASQWGVSGNSDRVLAHRDELASRGRAAVDYILEEHLNSWDGLEHRAVKAVFTENADYAVDRMMELLQDSLAPGETGNIIGWLGDADGEKARPLLEEMLADSQSVGITITLIRTLGDIGNFESLSVLEPFADSDSERIRRQTAVTLGEMGENALELLELLAADECLSVRSAASRSLDGINSDR